MRWLARISAFGDARPNQAVEFRQARAICERRGLVENAQQQVEQLVVLGRQLAGAKILGQIIPVAVDANPYLEQRRLMLLHGPIAGRGKGANALARPH